MQASEATYEDQKEQLDAGMQEAEEKIAGIKVENENVQDELARATAKHTQITGEIAEAHAAKMEAMEATLNSDRAARIKTQQEAVEVVQSAAAKQKAVIALGRHAQEVLEQKETEVSEKMAADKKALSDKVAQDGQILKDRKTELAEYKEKLSKLTGEDSALAAQIVENTKKRDALRAELRNIQEKGSESLKYKTMAAHEEVQQKDAKLDMIKMEIQRHEDVIRLLKEKLAHAAGAEHVAESRVADREKRESSLQDSVDAMEPKLQKEQAELADAQKSAKSLHDAEDTFEGEIQKQHSALYKEQEAVDSAANNAQKAEEEFNMETASATQVATRLGELQARVDQLEVQARTKEKKITEVNSQEATLTSQEGSEHQALTEDEAKLAKEQRDLAAAKAAGVTNAAQEAKVTVTPPKPNLE